MNKRGIIQEKLHWIIIEFILLGMFITGSLAYISNINSSSLYERIYLSKALAIRTTTTLAAPGELLSRYAHKELENFETSLLKDRIVVTAKEKKDSAFQQFPESAYTNIKPATLTQERILFEKQDNYVALNPEADIYLLKEECPAIESTAQGLMLDPAHGEFDKGIVKGSFIEAEINRQIAFQIFRNPPYKEVSSTRSVTQEMHRPLDKRLGDIGQKQGYALVSIQTNPEGEAVRAYINANTNVLQSRKLACKINNALAEVLPELIYTFIIPINPEHLDKNSPLQVLGAANIGVALEINYPDIRPEIIGEAVKKAIAEYKTR